MQLEYLENKCSYLFSCFFFLGGKYFFSHGPQSIRTIQWKLSLSQRIKCVKFDHHFNRQCHAILMSLFRWYNANNGPFFFFRTLFVLSPVGIPILTFVHFSCRHCVGEFYSKRHSKWTQTIDDAVVSIATTKWPMFRSILLYCSQLLAIRHDFPIKSTS